MSNCSHCEVLAKELAKARLEIEHLKNEVQKTQRTNPLTGLPNKVALDEKLQETIALNQRGHTHYLYFIDLDNFKQLNDKCSHEFGDEVLLAVAKSLANTVRETDTVFHISGDEFVIIAETDKPTIIRHKLHQAIESCTLKFKGQPIALGGSVGFCRVMGRYAKALLEAADMALQADKEDRRHQGLRHNRN